MRVENPTLRLFKKSIKAMPILGPALARLRGRSGDAFVTSADYWDRRYRAGGTSGAGSYNRLATFKADFLNRFVEAHDIKSVVEYGCGDGAQLRKAHYPSYIGIDVSEKAIEMCRTMFAGDATKRFLQSGEVSPTLSTELALSLDVIYHLVEDAVFGSYMHQLFGSASRYVIVYSSNIDIDWPARHVRHRQFTHWVERNKPDWCLQSSTPNPFPHDAADPDNTSFANFYIFAPR